MTPAISAMMAAAKVRRGAPGCRRDRYVSAMAASDARVMVRTRGRKRAVEIAGKVLWVGRIWICMSKCGRSGCRWGHRRARGLHSPSRGKRPPAHQSARRRSRANCDGGRAQRAAAAGIVTAFMQANFLLRFRHAASNLEICRGRSLPPIHILVAAAGRRGL